MPKTYKDDLYYILDKHIDNKSQLYIIYELLRNKYNINKLYIKKFQIGGEIKEISIFGKKYKIQSDTDERYEIDFKNSSSGAQTSIPISLITQYFSKNFSFEDAFNRSVLTYLSNTDKLTDFKAIKNLSEIEKKIFIHIEEPELSLYPDTQCQLINDMVNKCFISTKNNIEIMLSTHSPYIINQLNLLIKAYEKNKFEEGANYDFNQLSVYQVIDGKLENLMAVNEKLVNTNPLSDTINNIYSKYRLL